MLYVLFAVIALQLVFNWMLKSDEKTDKQKEMINKVISCVIIAASIVCLIVQKWSVFFYIYLPAIIVSNALKTVWIGNGKKLVGVITNYVDVLFTIVACCVVWHKIAYIIAAIGFLMLLIMVHEFGHYIAGKILKFKITEFSIGFGPAIFSKTKANGEKFSIRVIPLGGYCSFDGEDEDKESDGAFNKQKPWKRLIVLFSGVLFNFLFGLVMSVVYLSMAYYTLPQVIAVSDYSNNGLQKGDIILEINDNKLNYYRVSKIALEQLSEELTGYGEGEEITLKILRDGKEEEVVVKKHSQPAFRYVLSPESAIDNAYYLQGENSYVKFATAEELHTYLKNVENELTSVYKYNAENSEYVAYTEEEISSLCQITTSTAGVSLGILQTNYVQKYSFWQALLYALPFCLDICWLILITLGGIFTGATAVADLGGTVTTVGQIAELTSMSFKNFLYLIPLISMNLAVFNILPIPALDGARMVFVAIEAIRKKPINRNVEGYIHFVGLLVLFAFVIFLDVYHIFIL